MDKIKELLAKIGASKELVEEIVKEFDAYRVALREQQEKEFRTRMMKARDVCLEEVQTYKENLARRVEVFIESVRDRVERDVKKQVAIEESQAVAELKKVKEILGMDSGKADEEALQAVASENKSLKRKLAEITEEKVQLSKQAARSKDIAGKALKQNRALQEEISKRNPEGTRLEEDRKPEAKPKTTRPTITESQTKKPAEDQKPPAGDPKVVEIANGLEEDI